MNNQGARILEILKSLLNKVLRDRLYAKRVRVRFIDAAYSAFEEDIKGSLSPGKLADLTVLSGDILSVPEAEIPHLEVLMTMVGGRVAYLHPGGRIPALAN